MTRDENIETLRALVRLIGSLKAEIGNYSDSEDGEFADWHEDSALGRASENAGKAYDKACLLLAAMSAEQVTAV